MDHLINGVKYSEADLIVLLGSGHTALIQMLAMKSNVFRLPMTAVMTNEDGATNFPLHLDTNIVTIQENGGSENYVLREIYSIKRGPKITSVIGNWSKDGGLDLVSVNLHERRKNLGGTELRDAILPYTKITQPVTDNNNNLVDSGGVFQGCL